MEYKKVEGKDLIEGDIYFLSRNGDEKVLYKGIVYNNTMKEPRCLFQSLEKETGYVRYGEEHYDGKYIGLFSINMERGYFFKEIA